MMGYRKYPHQMDRHYITYLKWRAKKLAPSDPKTPEEFAKSLNLPLQALLEFEARPSFEDDLRKASLSWLQSKIPELLHVAYQEAKESKDVGDIEKLVDIAHRLRKKSEEGGNQFNFFNLNDETINRIAQRQLGSGIAGREARILTASSEE
jgi:hypothetical protein